MNDFLRARTGQDDDQRPLGIAVFLQKRRVEPLAAHFVEVGMADERGVAAPLGKPAGLKRQAAQDVIDKAAHFFDAPTGPGPNLRRGIIEHRNPVCLGAAGNPPVKARIVDQHDRVGTLVAKVSIGASGQRQELVNVQQHAQKPHHGQSGQIGMQSAAGFSHLGTAVADGFELGAALPQLANQISAVEVTAGFAGGKEDLHAVAAS